jgi:serine/threonine protein kinase
LTDNDDKKYPAPKRGATPGKEKRDQNTTQETHFANIEGNTTMLSGISGTTLAYLPGDIVDGAYQLTKLLGRGGMGAVFSCLHLTLNQSYALKLLSADQLSSEAWNRFQAEAKSLARLKHPGIVSIYNMGIDKGQCPYYVMDLISGEPLDSLIARVGPVPVEQALDLFIQVADALASAHLQGIIHRDIKPSNLMLQFDSQSQTLRVKLVDFGIARLSKQGLVTQSQTATGLIFGTPFYMSPEQCHGSRVDERSDIYSLGCALFETLTGRPPFVGDSAFHTFMLHQTEEAPTLASRMPEEEPSESLEMALGKMLRKSPDERYQAMKQVKHDLERIKAGKSILAQGTATLPPSTTPVEKALAQERTHQMRNQKNAVNFANFQSGIDAKAWRLSLAKGAAAIALVSALLIGGWYGFHFTTRSHNGKVAALDLTPTPIVPKSQVNEVETDPAEMMMDEGPYPKSLMKAFGASANEIASFTLPDLNLVSTMESRAERTLEACCRDKTWKSTKFLKDGVFHFSHNFFIGSISIGDDAPKLARGNIKAPPDRDAALYLSTGTRKKPELLDKFGPTDLTGVYMVFARETLVEEAIDKVSNWKRLKDLWFFNPLLKTIAPNTDSWGESEITDRLLPSLDNIKGLRSVGICNPASGSAILKRPFLKHIESLGLRRIADFKTLFNRLPDFNNLKEILLMTQSTKDQDLEVLTRMKNLRKLTILRGFLTTDSLRFFQQMKSLKKLRLDRNDWTPEQRENFQKNLPNCEVTYEKVIDRAPWPMCAQDVVENERSLRSAP